MTGEATATGDGIGLHRWLMLPWWALQLATGAKSFRDNPLIGSRRLNAAGLHVGRKRLAHRMADWRRRRLARLVPAEDRAGFKQDGFVLKRDFLPPEMFAALREQVMAFQGPAREMMQGDTLTRRFALDPHALRAMPAARALLRDPAWRGLTRYVGSSDAEPVTYIQVIRSHVDPDAPPDPQTAFHADTFQPTVKAWLFLTDVAEDGGAFAYVPGSHRLTPAREAWERRMSLEAGHGDDRLSARGSPRIGVAELPALGLPPPRLFAVPANTLVVADTSGFHARGPSLRPTTRIEIWAYGRRSPFLPWTGLDGGSLPGIAERRATFAWWVRDRLQRHVGQPWRDAGAKRPGD